MYWGSMVLSWLAQLPHSKKVLCSNPALGLYEFACSLLVFQLPAPQG